MNPLTLLGDSSLLDILSTMPEAPERLTVSTDDGLVFAVAGELDAHGAPDLAEALSGVDAAADVVLDLGELTFMDSSGLRVIISTNGKLSSGGGSLVLRRPGRTVQRILSISGLEGHIAVDDAI